MAVHKRASSTREATRSKLSQPPAPDDEAAGGEPDDEGERLKDGLDETTRRRDVRPP